MYMYGEYNIITSNEFNKYSDEPYLFMQWKKKKDETVVKWTWSKDK